MLANSEIPARSDSRLAARSAALIFVAAGVLNLVESRIPGGPALSTAPGLAALAFGLSLYLAGPRLPMVLLALLGPIGATMVAVGMATTDGPGDGALLYIWPVLWEAWFFGRRGAVAIVAWVGIVHGVALLELPPGAGYPDRWIDVMASIGVVAVVVDLLSTRIGRLLARLEEEARVDDLTGLLNRRGFGERVQPELARARRRGSSLGMVSFDLDRFKGVNDEFGHDIGDEVLVLVAECMRKQMRPEDVLARMGGEEFIALLPEAGAAEAGSLAERVRESLARTRDPRLPKVTVSAGVAAAVAPGDVEVLLRGADRALYAAKRAGRDRTVMGPAGTDGDLGRLAFAGQAEPAAEATGRRLRPR